MTPSKAHTRRSTPVVLLGCLALAGHVARGPTFVGTKRLAARVDPMAARRFGETAVRGGLTRVGRFGMLPWRSRMQDGSVEATNSTVGAWRNIEVLAWVDSLAPAFKAYRKVFEENGIDGEALLSLTEDDLRGEEFGITNKYHIKGILRARDAAGCINLNSLRERNLNSIQAPNLSDDPDAFVKPPSAVVLSLLNDAGIVVDDWTRIIAKEMDGAFHDSVLEALRLDAVEALCTFTMDKAALIRSTRALPGGAVQSADSVPLAAPTSIIEEAKRDVWVVLDARRQVISSTCEVQSCSRDLLMAIQEFVDAAGRPLSEKQRSKKLQSLQKAFSLWRKSLSETGAKSSEMGEALFARSKERLSAIQAGGSAVKQNMEELDHVTIELIEAQAKRKAIIDSPDPNVQLALQARSGALTDMIASTEARIPELHQTIAELKKIQKSKVNIIQQVEQFAVDANAKKTEMRDWHIKRWWRSMWKDEMAVYDRQVDENIDAQNREKLQAEKAGELLDSKIKELEEGIKKKSVELADMQTARSTWNKTLTAVGLFVVEGRVEAAQHKFELIVGVLQSAMHDAGVGNPVEAAQIIAMHHKTQVLMSGAAKKAQDTTQKVKSLSTKFDSMIESIEAEDPVCEAMEVLAAKLRLVAKVVGLIGDYHEKRMQLLDDGHFRGQVIREYICSELGVQDHVQPPQLEE